MRQNGAFLACGSMVHADLLYAVFPRVARKNRIHLKWSTALPKAQCANCVSPILIGFYSAEWHVCRILPPARVKIRQPVASTGS